MKLSTFLSLSPGDKKHSVVHLGILVDKRSYLQYLVLLFRLDDLYVEVWCNRGSKGIDEYRVLNHPKALDPYLEKISIKGLI